MRPRIPDEVHEMARKTKAQIKAEEDAAQELAARGWHNDGAGWRRRWCGWELALGKTTKPYKRDLRWYCRLEKSRAMIDVFYFDDVATMDDASAMAKADAWLARRSLVLAKDLIDLALCPTLEA